MEESAEQLLSAMADQKEELRKEIADLQAELEQYRWVPVEERLPEKRSGDFPHLSPRLECVNAYIGGSWLDRYDYNANKWRSELYRYTHWRYLILPEVQT